MKSPVNYPNIGPVHLVGIAGLGMSGLGFLLREQHVVVTGSDQKKTSQAIQLLRARGVTVYTEHQPSNVENAKIVVASSAIKEVSPEIVRAKELGIPIYSRGQFLAEFLRRKYVVGVCGSHGKTTTTAMCLYLLQKMGYAPGFMLGVHWSAQRGLTASWGGSLLWGDSSLFVCETDESDGSFGALDPTWTIVTNVEDDHLDFYGTQAEMDKSFVNFIKKTPFYGKTIMCIDDPGVQRILQSFPKRFAESVRTYGVSSDADVCATNFHMNKIETTFTVTIEKKKEISVTTNLMGAHNIQNIIAAIAWVDVLGLDVKKATQYLRAVPELERRLKKIGEVCSLDVLDDYAHHPYEISMAIQAVQQRYEVVIACVQPHRYSRVRQFSKNFAISIRQADFGFVMPVYAAGEPFDPLSTSEEIASVYDQNKKIVLVENVVELRTAIEKLQIVKHPGAILFMGAGDISELAQQFVDGSLHG